MRRALLAFLAVLLLSMQHEGLVHPLAHLAFRHAPDTGLVAPSADAACAECTLLAAGGNAVTGASPHLAVAVTAAMPSGAAPRGRDADAPAWFRSRAPPVLL